MQEEEPPQADCKRKLLKVVVTVLFIIIVVGVVVIWSLHEGRSRKHIGNHYFDFVSTKRVLNVYNKQDSIILTGYLKVSHFDIKKVKKCEEVVYHDNFCFKFLDGTHFTFHPYSLPNSDVKCVDLRWENLKSFHNVPTDCYDVEYGLWYGLPNFKGPFWPLRLKETSLSNIPYRPFHNKILGYVLENYWLSTEGVAIIAHQNLPLKVSFNSGNDSRLCLTLDVKGMNMKSIPALNYSICQGKDIKDVFTATRNVYFPHSAVSDLEHHDFANIVWSYEDKYHNNNNNFGQFLHSLKSADLPIEMIAYNSDWEKNQGDIKIQQSVLNDFKQYLEGKYSETKLMLPINVACSYTSDNFNRGVKERLFVKDPETGSFQTIRYEDQSCALWDASNPRTRSFLREAFENLQQKDTMEETEFPQAVEFRTTVGDSVYPLLLYVNTSDVNQMNAEFLHVLLNLNKSILMQTAFRMQNKPVFVKLPTIIANKNDKKCLDYILSGALTAGIHGYPYVLAVPPPVDKIDHEFSIRWIEIAIFFPGIMITNSAINFGDDIKNVTKQLVEFRKSVIIAHLSNAIKDVVSGIPIIRPLWWINPADYVTLNISDQFLIGDTLMVAPILCHGDRKRDIYIPQGKWISAKTGQIFHGRQWLKDFAVPLHEVPTFLAYGSLNESSTHSANNSGTLST